MSIVIEGNVGAPFQIPDGIQNPFRLPARRVEFDRAVLAHGAGKLKEHRREKVAALREGLKAVDWSGDDPVAMVDAKVPDTDSIEYIWFRAGQEIAMRKITVYPNKPTNKDERLLYAAITIAMIGFAALGFFARGILP